jgi:hypothetical protein
VTGFEKKLELDIIIFFFGGFFLLEQINRGCTYLFSL